MRIGSVALALSGLALGLAVFALTREAPQAARASMRTDRVAALEAQIAQLRRDVAALREGRPEQATEDLPGLPSMPRPVGTADSGRSREFADDDGELKAIVDDAVERKAEQVLDELRVKENKKPAIDVFAAALELSREQRAVTERVVVEGQRQIHRILEVPTSSGSNLMDDLVEIAARGIAEPGKDHGFGRWLGRVLTEKIPGTDQTYATRIEAVKTDMRAVFRREWSEAQYREFETWGVDPSEVQNVPGSPNEELAERIAERARELGAVIPEQD